RRSGLPAARVIGTGTLLDTSRLQQTLGERLNLAPHSIEALVLGEHGDSEVAALSAVRIGGVSLAQYGYGEPDMDPAEIGRSVREAAYGIVAGKGYTSFGIATAIVRLCEAILRDERAVLPVSTLMTGQYDLDGMYLSLPCVLGAGGVARVLTPPLTESELQGLQQSGQILGAAYAALESDPAFEAALAAASATRTGDIKHGLG
ncbi:MAG: lactate dehydrogenase, partial [Caulobacteraceae bacterium]|nr:lactate dehydrogenase [Caulobacteraceae bacterium]